MAQPVDETTRAEKRAQCEAHFLAGRWADALICADSALEDDPEDALALECSGRALRWLDQLDEAFARRERAFSTFRRQGDDVSAGRVATELAYDNILARNEVAVANGWFARARDLLDTGPATVERGWLRYREAQVAHLMDHDPANALALLGEAAPIARDAGDATLELAVTSLTGLAQVTLGEVEAGMTNVDKAATGIVAGEVSELEIAGVICCDVIFACEQVRDVERAKQWLRAAQQVNEQGQFTPLMGACHVHYATLLMWEGDWPGAERELERAKEAIDAAANGLALEHAIRLAHLRTLQGRYDEARSICEPMAWLPAAKLALANVAVASGSPELAKDLLRRCVEGEVEPDRSTLVDALALCVKVELALGDSTAAKEAAVRLRVFADELGLDPLVAKAELADGTIAAADGDIDSAISSIERAIDIWLQQRAPYEAALARLALAEILDSTDRRELARSERDQADRVLADLGVEPDSSERDATSDGPLTGREVEVLRLVADGFSDEEIAERLVLSPHTVHRHVANIRTKLDQPSRASAVAHAARAGLI